MNMKELFDNTQLWVRMWNAVSLLCMSLYQIVWSAISKSFSNLIQMIEKRIVNNLYGISVDRFLPELEMWRVTLSYPAG